MTRDPIPGRVAALAATSAIVALVVVVPLAAVVWAAHGVAPARLASLLVAPRTLAAFGLTFGASAAASLLDVLLGVWAAWVLTTRTFPGRALLDAVVDMPFALPTAVTGITLATLYGPHGWIGAPLLQHGIRVAYTPLGIVLALAFVGLPFVVRTVQPVLADLPRDLADAARGLGASPLAVARRITIPLALPAIATGFALSFARTLGEYGSVVFIAGNFPGRTEIVPLLVLTHLEEYDQAGAAAIATVMLAAALGLVLAINALQRHVVRVHAGA
ncbi:MAG: sulfate/thiosulfate transport system permease protein [Candidatus Eremiobacteraeota bacterium]|jgi:sulfate transport system permease protein|nr:sulfate/thiosulfate transport system permease protein [Candidatus Eremiobacteraeota bacterium]MEA2718676.1 sulfate/thiosulfate transport system permease protein [Candidatus Eremiobacteraeota bacterium]